MQASPIDYQPLGRLEIAVRFADLRRLAHEVPPYLATMVGTQNEPWTLRTAVEDDWGVAGLDTEELLLAFGEKYRVDLTKFDFTGFISPEGLTPWQGCVATVLLPSLLFLWLIKTAVAGLCWLFNRSWASAIWHFSLTSIGSKPRPYSEVLTTGDFVASAAAGLFVKRERVRFALARQ
ncbi:DUF1493 family protein [Hymenobacter profundi]|uniref:DUF1493 family protein n=1 Tax=Hymenobacter profundi TaxID=1982110 RepID=A0ABS6WU13_9BACT|nr:DUF1493 family protein [Hymenobacter profundi]MBW3126943.1 DUF1493 family protein [Hymenobacter profundi]MBW3127066.1 DUF1493 family protein [Hymenobacter profundi]